MQTVDLGGNVCNTYDKGLIHQKASTNYLLKKKQATQMKKIDKRQAFHTRGNVMSNKYMEKCQIFSSLYYSGHFKDIGKHSCEALTKKLVLKTCLAIKKSVLSQANSKFAYHEITRQAACDFWGR